MTPAWKAAIFDLDGTVMDTIPLIVESYQHTFTTILGVSHDEDWIRSTIGTPLITVLTSVAAEHAETMLETYLEYNLSRVAGTPLCPGIHDALDALSTTGCALGIATAKRRHSAVATLNGSGLAERLPVLTAYEDTERHKPQPDPILHALDSLGIEPQDAVYIGDAVVDILAARAAGVTAIAVSSGAASHNELAAAQPDFLFHSLAELPAVVGA